MTRPKVDPDKRQRTANACDSCKKRKQKCNGDKPCGTCRKRMQDSLCSYETSHSKLSDEAPPMDRPKPSHHSEPRKLSEPTMRASFAPNQVMGMSLRNRRSSHPMTVPPNPLSATHDWQSSHIPLSHAMGPPGTLNRMPGSDPLIQSMTYIPPGELPPPQAFWPPPGQVIIDYVHQRKTPTSFNGPVASGSGLSRRTVNSEGPQVLVIQPQSTPQGQQQGASKTLAPIEEEAARNNKLRRSSKSPQVGKPFWGDTSNTAFLKHIKSTTENLIGMSPFTLDTEELEIETTSTKIADGIEPGFLLPSQDTSKFLNRSFFSTTSGLVNLFSQQLLEKKLRECRNNSITVHSSWRCSINLVFAIGVLMACPVPNSAEWNLLNTLTAKSGVQKTAEKFYCDALNHRNPTKDIGEARIWKIQALSLMSIFLLLVSRGSEAHAYHCMAVQSATSMGLHTDDASSSAVDGNVDAVSRKNIWQSLFILDQFMAASLGRPKFIHYTNNLQLLPKDVLNTQESPRYLGFPAIKATTRSCNFISNILERVYSGFCLLNGHFQELAKECLNWPNELDDNLRWQVEDSVNSDEKTAIIHVNLFYTQSVILISRPSFIKELQLLLARRNSLQSTHALPLPDKRGLFARICVAQCCHSILLVRLAFEKLYLSPYNMFAINFLFGSALVVFTSQLFDLFPHETGVTCIQSAMNILQRCGNQNPQARRMYQILGNFHDVLLSRGTHIATTLVPSQLNDTKSLLFLTDQSTSPHLVPESGTSSAITGCKGPLTFPAVDTGQKGYYDPMADIANARSPFASPNEDSPEDSQKSFLDTKTTYNLGEQLAGDKIPVWDTGWPTHPNSFYNEQSFDQYGLQFGIDPSLSESYDPFASTNWNA